MTTLETDVLIAGGGLAGLTVAETLRAQGYDAPLLWCGQEPHPPYHRPPLSKAMLSQSEAQPEQLWMRSSAALANKQLQLLSGCKLSAIDAAGHCVSLADGRQIRYRKLVLATGARARPWPLAQGQQWHNLFSLRTIEDALALQAQLIPGRRLVVIGGGFIGLEVAAVAAQLGLHVVVLEQQQQLMGRVVSPAIAEFFAQLHRRHGVSIEFGCEVTALHGQDGRLQQLSDQHARSYAADVFVVGIGAIANADLAAAAGLHCHQGAVVVDAYGQSSDADIFAAGDCAITHNSGQWQRLESVNNATEQGRTVAFSLLGQRRERSTPWFWSDQHGVKLQMAGLSAGYEQVVERVHQPQQKFSLCYFRHGQLIAVDSVACPQDHLAARKVLDGNVPLSPEQAADVGRALG